MSRAGTLQMHRERIDETPHGVVGGMWCRRRAGGDGRRAATRRDAEGGGDGFGERHVQGGLHRDVLWENRTDAVRCKGRPVGEAPALAEFHRVESASALHHGLEIEDEEDGEVRRGDSLLIRLGTNEGGTAEDLPLPEDAPARPGELLLLVSPQVAMDLGEEIQRALRAYLNATKGNV